MTKLLVLLCYVVCIILFFIIDHLKNAQDARNERLTRWMFLKKLFSSQERVYIYKLVHWGNSSFIREMPEKPRVFEMYQKHENEDGQTSILILTQLFVIVNIYIVNILKCYNSEILRSCSFWSQELGMTYNISHKLRGYNCHAL